MTLIDVLQSLTVADVARLLLCIVVDLIGFVSYLVPGVGETVDVVWAPVRPSGSTGRRTIALSNSVRMDRSAPSASASYCRIRAWPRSPSSGSLKRRCPAWISSRPPSAAGSIISIC